MPLFPDEFPFKKPTTPQPFIPAEPEIAQIPAEPVVAAEQIVPEEPVPQPLPAAAPVAVEHERRRSPRQAFLARALVRNEIGNAPGWKVDLLNISMLGIRFRSERQLIVGDKASVKLEVGPLRWATKLRVIHSVQLDDGNFAIGCQFISNELARPIRRAA